MQNHLMETMDWVDCPLPARPIRPAPAERLTTDYGIPSKHRAARTTDGPVVSTTYADLLELVMDWL